MDVNGTVTCAVVAWSGDTSFDVARASSKTTLTTISTALRADSTLGGVVADSSTSGVQTFQTRVGGTVLRRVFLVRFTAYEADLGIEDDVMEALRTLFTAADLKVLDGTDVQSSERLKLCVVVGGDGDPNGQRPAAVTDNPLGTFGP